MALLIATEAALFAYLLFSYFYLAVRAQGPWPTAGPPGLDIAIPNTVILLASSASLHWAERGVRGGDFRRLRWGPCGDVLLGSRPRPTGLRVQRTRFRPLPTGTAARSYHRRPPGNHVLVEP